MLNASHTFKDSVRARYTKAEQAIPDKRAEAVYIKRAQKGDEIAMHILFERQLPFLLNLAKSPDYAGFSGSQSELVAAAYPDFIKGVKDFDLSSGYRLVTYLYDKMRNAMNKVCYADRLVHVPENHIKNKKADELASVVSGHKPINGNETISIFDTLKGAGPETIVDEVVKLEQERLLDKLMTVLGGEEKSLLDSVYNNNMSLAEHGRMHGFSKDRVRKIHANALAKLRQAGDADREWCLDTKVV